MNRKPSMGWSAAGRTSRPSPAQPRTPSPPDPPEGDHLASLHAQADKLISCASQSSSSSSAGRSDSSLEELLCRLHASESIRDSRSSHLNLATNLLHKLSSSPSLSLSRLVITLHPGDEGYSLSLLTSQASEVELAKFSSEDTELLDSVDQQVIPVAVMDLISESVEEVAGDLYQDGSVVCEVRDARRGGRVKSHLVLLKASTQSIICDSISLSRPCSSQQTKWTPEDKLNLESQVRFEKYFSSTEHQNYFRCCLPVGVLCVWTPLLWCH